MLCIKYERTKQLEKEVEIIGIWKWREDGTKLNIRPPDSILNEVQELEAPGAHLDLGPDPAPHKTATSSCYN